MTTRGILQFKVLNSLSLRALVAGAFVISSQKNTAQLEFKGKTNSVEGNQVTGKNLRHNSSKE